MEAAGGDGYVHSDCGDGFPGAHMCQKITHCALEVCTLFICQLSLNTWVK